MSATLELTKILVNCPSITPTDAECQTILTERLVKLGFQIESLPFGEVNNFWAKRGTAEPLLVFIGHTDVVPTGPLTQWTSPPFQAEVRDGYLYGRGTADMKGSLAAMLIACENFISKHPHHQGAIAWLITSDEEGPSVDGTAKVVEVLKTRGEKIAYCIVGEPSSTHKLGDVIKIGRRGTLSAKLNVLGKQGHIAYPHLADNPIHKLLPALTELIATQWDTGNDYFQPTCLQISNLNSGTGASNVIPGNAQIQFNFRYSPAVTAEFLQDAVIEILNRHTVSYEMTWQHSGKPFLTTTGKLTEVATDVIKTITGISPTLSTSGGTSDGRFIAPLGPQIIELGPCNDTIHQINECVSISDLEKLTIIYENILEKLLTEK